MGLFDFLKRETESDHDAAIRLYDEATQEYSAKRYAAAVTLYEQAWSKDPDVNTFFNLSICYYYEWGTTKNETRCFEVTRHAALKGNSQAMNNLGFFYNTGYGCTQDKAEGRRWIEKSAKLLNLSACRTLAHIYHDESETNPPVLHQCYTLLKTCADKNYKDT
ncbi:MAG: sel1 repeat family protein [Prevotella sp.]|nr:sel1 repeat family protein [Prevotella sp.]